MAEQNDTGNIDMPKQESGLMKCWNSIIDYLECDRNIRDQEDPNYILDEETFDYEAAPKEETLIARRVDKNKLKPTVDWMSWKCIWSVMMCEDDPNIDDQESSITSEKHQPPPNLITLEESVIHKTNGVADEDMAASSEFKQILKLKFQKVKPAPLSSDLSAPATMLVQSSNTIESIEPTKVNVKAKHDREWSIEQFANDFEEDIPKLSAVKESKNEEDREQTRAASRKNGSSKASRKQKQVETKQPEPQPEKPSASDAFADDAFAEEKNDVIVFNTDELEEQEKPRDKAKKKKNKRKLHKEMESEIALDSVNEISMEPIEKPEIARNLVKKKVHSDENTLKINFDQI